MADRILQHDGKVYEVQLDGRVFARVYRLAPVLQTGILATTLEELVGHPLYSYDRIVLDERETIDLAMAMGRGCFRRQAWRNLYDWAEMHHLKFAGDEAEYAGLEEVHLAIDCALNQAKEAFEELKEEQ